nr:KGG domain-containing protein [Nannocystis bainbridge]
MAVTVPGACEPPPPPPLLQANPNRPARHALTAYTRKLRVIVTTASPRQSAVSTRSRSRRRFARCAEEKLQAVNMILGREFPDSPSGLSGAAPVPAAPAAGSPIRMGVVDLCARRAPPCRGDAVDHGCLEPLRPAQTALRPRRHRFKEPSTTRIQSVRDRGTNMPNSTGNSGERRGGRGFAGMDAEKQREIARKGGRAAHEKGTAHEFDSDEARAAGRKGGEVVSQNREHMAEIGAKGGHASHSNRANSSRDRNRGQRSGQGMTGVSDELNTELEEREASTSSSTPENRSEMPRSETMSPSGRDEGEQDH